MIGQLALSTVILVDAGLFFRSIAYLNYLDVGYSRTRVVVLSAIYPDSQEKSAQMPQLFWASIFYQ